MTTPDEPLRETRVTGEYLDVKADTTWQGKTNGYIRTEKVVLKIVDGQKREVEAAWEADWRACASGIETRNGGGETVRHLLGRTSYETRVDQCVRIYRHACPVSIQFRATNEYVDYNDSQYSSRDESVYWIHYVA
jgi:hypothetical protein